MEKLMLTITCFNTQGKQYKHTETCDDMNGVARCLLTFKPKRGYDPVDYRIVKEIVLI